MIQMDMFPSENNTAKSTDRISIGNSYSLEWVSRTIIIIYRMGIPFRNIEVKAQIDKRRIAVELVLECGAVKSKLAEALRISRQSLDNWIDTYKRSGFEGLVNSYKGGKRSGRSLNAENLPTGNKARILEEERRQKDDRLQSQQLLLDFEKTEKIEEDASADDGEPAAVFNETFEFQENRYAGSLIYWGIFQHVFGFMSFCEKYLGHSSIVVYLFVMMLVNKIESVEQLKVVFKREFGKILGIPRLFSKPVIWDRIYDLCGLRKSKAFIEAFFDHQAKNNLISLNWLYIDGHFIPYYGKEHVHKGFYTQRDEMMPGQTQSYVHDGHGQVVYFETQEGKGDLKEMMHRMSERWSNYLGGDHPLIIADRESWGVEHFISMQDYRFVTWEKFSKAKELRLIPTEAFGQEFMVNDIKYQAFESEKEYKEKNGNRVTLRRIVIWNKKSNRRIACVTQLWEKENMIAIAAAILGRWGASENSFKHMADRFNMHYNPVKDASKYSGRQDMANPEYKRLQQSMAGIKNRLARCERNLGQLPLTTKKDGSLRRSEKRETLITEQKTLKMKIEELSIKMKECPERIQIVNENEMFRQIEVEGKNYWDLAQGLAWNSRKKLMNMFREFLPNPRDLLPVLDAVTKSHGWIRSTDDTVEVLLEPLDTPAYKNAQFQLCGKLTGMNIKLHNGKRLIYGVGHMRENVQKK